MLVSRNTGLWTSMLGVLLFLLFAGCSRQDRKDVETFTSTAPYTARVILKEVDPLTLEFTDESSLSSLLALRSTDEGGVIWAEDDPPLFDFDSVGAFAGAFPSSVGKGPGEVEDVEAFDQGLEGSIYVYDGDNSRVSVYGPDREFVNSYRVDVGRLRNMAVSPDGIVYFLRSAYYREGGAVMAYDVDGSLLYNWGEIPFSAKVQDELVGGGIAVDTAGYVYYGYISDHRIWKTTSSGATVAVFDERPSYYKSPDIKELESFEGDHEEAIKRMSHFIREASQVVNIFLIPKKSLLFQVIITRGVTRYDMVFELWHTDGFKIASNVNTPGLLRFADEDFLYFDRPGKSELEENPYLDRYSYELERIETAPSP